MAQRELARHCASTALASTMHHHVVLFTAWRYRRGLPGAEATLRRVADEGHRAGLDRRRRPDPPPGRGRAGRRRLPGQRPQDLRQPVAGGHRPVDDVPVRRPRRGPHRAQHGRADGRRGRDGARHLGRLGHAGHRQPRRRAGRRVRPRGAGARPPALRPARPAAAGDPEHRHAAHRRRLPRRRRGGPRPRRRRRGRHGQGRRPDRAAPGRPHGHPAAGRRVGARRRPRHGGRRPDAVDGHRRGRHGRQAGDRPRRHRGLRPGHGRRRRRGLLPDLSPSSSATATSGAPSSTRSRRRSRSSTPARSPSGSPPTSAEAHRACLPARALPGRQSDPQSTLASGGDDRRRDRQVRRYGGAPGADRPTVSSLPCQAWPNDRGCTRFRHLAKPGRRPPCPTPGLHPPSPPTPSGAARWWRAPTVEPSPP